MSQNIASAESSPNQRPIGPDSSFKHIHERLRYYRKLRGLTMQALAEEVGTSQQQIDRLEKGKRRLTIEWLQKLSDALQCEIVDLMPDNASQKKAASTCRTKVVGRLQRGKRIEWLEQSESYPLIVGRPNQTLSKRLFAIRVEAANRYKFPIGSELIFSEIEPLATGLPDSLGKQHHIITAEPHLEHLETQYILTKWSPDIEFSKIRAVLIKTIRDEF